MIGTPVQPPNDTKLTSLVIGMVCCACPTLGMCCCMPSASASVSPLYSLHAQVE
jgi:hypothetical protein